MARVQTTTAKQIRADQLKAELGADIFTSGDTVEAEGCTQAELEAAVAAHVADPEWRPAGPERDWRVALQNEIDAIDAALANPATNWTSAAVIRRIARNQARILRYIRDQELDAE